MDQTASSVGDAVAIDFKDPANPIVRSINADLTGLGLALCIIDCGADHAALTNEYASIPEEMSKVAAHFGKKVLREVKEEDLWQIWHRSEKKQETGQFSGLYISMQMTEEQQRKQMHWSGKIKRRF